ncbi:GNAT family N-acetyltransferase [Paenibacillus tengchongensis]|uniref:GNAT family N-acetyltransferase n=1 Tax=Paenibacillus tengchongensis TaxID=2608684 RepID=UPI001652664A|nr:GNAT family N-acetyltransferase [Paenibacillus tengchongensis]
MKPLQYVARIEQIEIELTQLNASRSLVEVPRQLEVQRLGQCILLRDPGDPAPGYYNRVKGLGPADLHRLDEVLACYPHTSPLLDLTPDQMKEEVAAELSRRGFIPVEQLVFMQTKPVFLAELTEVTAEPRVTVERVHAGNAGEYVRWIADSMGGKVLSPEMVERSRDYFYRPDFLNYMISIDGQPAAMGSLFVCGQEGYITNDYTFAAFRGRGLQTALLNHRLRDAAERGLTNVYTDVVFGSVSHANMEKAGFRTAFLNTFWMKPEKVI